MLPTIRSERELQRQAARERRNAQRLNRRELLTRVASGESRAAIATEQAVSLRSLQRALKRAAAEQPRENRSIHKALQIERLRRALRVTDAKLAEGDLNAVFALTRLLPMLKAYEDFEPDKFDYEALYAGS